MRILLLGFKKKDSNYEIKSLISELKKRGHEVDYIFWSGLIFSFSKKGVGIKTAKGKDLKYYDYIIPRSPLARGREHSNVYLSHLYRHYLLIVDYIHQYHKHVLNEKTISAMPFYDKLFQYYLLAKSGLPVVPSLLYTGRQIPDSVYKKFHIPYIAKSIEGSMGRQIFLIKNKSEIPPLLEEFGLGKILIQRYIPTNQDYRIIVVGSKVIGGMQRTAAEGEFRANVALGGYTENVKISQELEELALKVARIFNAEFAGVDVIKYKGKYYILEINIFPMFAGFEAATKINVAERLVAYIEKKYLWSIASSLPLKERMGVFDLLYLIEKENLEGPFAKKEFREELRTRDVIIVKKEQKPIAYLTYYQKGHIIYVSRLAIADKYRGQRIGRRMLRELIGLAKRDKDKKIQAVVPSSNKRRQQSFQRAGFKKTKTLKNHFSKGINGLVFEYKITPTSKVRGAGLTGG